MVGPRASRCIGTQMGYVVVWFADAKDLHEYVHGNVTWDHVNMFIMCRCQDKKIRRCQGFSCKRRTRYAAKNVLEDVKNTNIQICWKALKHRHTQRNMFTQYKHTDTHTNPHTHTEQLLHTEACTHKNFYTQKLLHTNTFTHRSFYTQKLLHTDAVTHRRFSTQKLLHTDAFTHRSFYTQALLHTDAFTHRSYYSINCTKRPVSAFGHGGPELPCADAANSQLRHAAHSLPTSHCQWWIIHTSNFCCSSSCRPTLWMLLLFCFPSGTAPMKHFQKMMLSSCGTGSLTWLRHLLLQAPWLRQASPVCR